MWSTVANVRSGYMTLQSALPQHLECLGARDLVNQMQADEELRLPDGQLPHGMGIPDFVE